MGSPRKAPVGQVTVAMLDSLIAMQGYLSQIYFVAGESPQPVGTRHPSIVPDGSFPTSDGHVIVACLTERFWHNFERCLRREDLIDDPRFAEYRQRPSNRDVLEPIIREIMQRNATAIWLERLTEFDVPNAPILSIGEALDQDHVAAHGLIDAVSHPEVGDMKLVRGPILFDAVVPAGKRVFAAEGSGCVRARRGAAGAAQAQDAQPGALAGGQDVVLVRILSLGISRKTIRCLHPSVLVEHKRSRYFCLDGFGFVVSISPIGLMLDGEPNWPFGSFILPIFIWTRR
ncbi:CoA transferase [Ruegeria marina]|uniref:CoA-transferase family III n=1 Tax=Ruegeria marina TaxID=639004 RepID=A0A1G7DYN8_9RHOB|nr:CoA transferase [Ruegeria marina]SDE56579.1 CoA-transferase family III [Ruegeria marina]